MSAQNPMAWLYNTFGSRRLVGCKESSDALYQGMAHPVAVERLAIDKRLDEWEIQPFYAAQQIGIVGTWATWGRPLSDVRVGENPALYLPEPMHYYDPGTVRTEGVGVSTPLDLGAVVRAMAADLMAHLTGGK